VLLLLLHRLAVTSLLSDVAHRLSTGVEGRAVKPEVANGLDREHAGAGSVHVGEIEGSK
jgi:hypothetical protein